MTYERILTRLLVFYISFAFLSQALEIKFQLTKDDCVQKCHSTSLLKNASSICADPTSLLCKAKHSCDQDDVCDCAVKFYCDGVTEKMNDLDYAATNDAQETTDQRLRTALQKIQNGGKAHVIFPNFKDETCMSLCKSSTIRNGCHFGYRCAVSATKCRNGVCTCMVDLVCHTETIYRTLTEVKPTKFLTQQEIVLSAQKNVKQISKTLKKTHVDFKIQDKSQCESRCEWVKSGACGSAFQGQFQCQFKIHCTKNVCTCYLNVRCQKSRLHRQEIMGKVQPKLIKKVANNETTYQIIDGQLVASAKKITTQAPSMLIEAKKRKEFNDYSFKKDRKRKRKQRMKRRKNAKQRKLKTTDDFEFF